jgi:hypothetical protein
VHAVSLFLGALHELERYHRLGWRFCCIEDCLELEIAASVHIEELVIMQNTAMLSLYAFVLLAMILSSS